MARLLDALRSGIQDSTAALTQDLQQTAVAAGWHPAAARSLQVDDEFQVQSNEAARAAEYGGLDSPPNAVIRNWSASGRVSQILLSTIERRLKEAGL